MIFEMNDQHTVRYNFFPVDVDLIHKISIKTIKYFYPINFPLPLIAKK